jgi:hypothetical protein
MKYRVGDIFVSKVTYHSPMIGHVGTITREYESNGLRYEITFDNNEGQKRTYSYTTDELKYRYSEEMGWSYYPVVK